MKNNNYCLVINTTYVILFCTILVKGEIQGHMFKNLTTSIKEVSNTTLMSTNHTTQIDNSTSTASVTHNTTIMISNNSLTDTLLCQIVNQTEKIKEEICFSCIEINAALENLDAELTLIKQQIDLINQPNSEEIDEIYRAFTDSINSINVINANLFTLNEVLGTLKHAECKGYEENLKKFSSMQESASNLLEFIQSVIPLSNLNFNIVILS